MEQEHVRIHIYLYVPLHRELVAKTMQHMYVHMCLYVAATKYCEK